MTHQDLTSRPGSDPLPAAGVALIVAGALLAGINLILTPRLGVDGDFVEVASSSVFLTRQLLASLIALLLLYGLVGLHQFHAGASTRSSTVAFAFAFFGTAVLLPLEWGQAFIIHDLANASPTGLEDLENQAGFSLFDLSAAISAGGFALGWIVYAGWMLRARRLSRVGPGLVIVGLLGLPLLAAVIGPLWGQIIGSVVVGAGWMVLGRGVRMAN